MTGKKRELILQRRTSVSIGNVVYKARCIEKGIIYVVTVASFS